MATSSERIYLAKVYWGMSSSMKSKTVNGFKWGLIDNFANSGVTFIVGLFLARLLSPEEFGVLGIITVFINISVTIIDGGLATALIRKKEVHEVEYNTVFYSNLVVSLLLLGILCAGSNFIADFFHQPVLEPALSVMSVVLLINALSLVHKTILIKKIDFKSQAIFSLVSSLLSGIVGISMAYNGMGIWSLVGQQLSRQVLLTISFWIVGKWVPKMMFSVACFKELYNFGLKLLAANLINTLFKDAFLVVIGKIYSTKDLGYYKQAEQFNAILSNNFSQIVRKVTLPALSQIQDEKERLKVTYRRLFVSVAIVSFAAVFVFSAISKPLLLLLIGEKWLPSVKLLQIMSLYAAIYPLNILNLNVLNLCKRSDYLLKLEVIKKILFVPVIVVGFFTNMEIMLWAAVIYYYVEFFINGWYTKKLISYGLFEQVRDVFPIYFVSLSVALLASLLTALPIANWVMLLLQVSVALVLLVLVYRCIRQTEYMEIEKFCISKVRRR